MSAPASPEQFGEKLLAFWTQAVKGEVKLPCSNHKEVVSLRHRLYRLRRAMIDKEHPIAAMAEKVVLRIEPFIKEDGSQIFYLVATHADRQFDSILAGFEIEKEPEI